MVLVTLGGLLGLSFAYLGVPAMVSHLPADLPRTSEIAVDGRVLVFTGLISLATAILFGLLPLFSPNELAPTIRSSRADGVPPQELGPLLVVPH
jgi:putative ABC transport system permease protein